MLAACATGADTPGTAVGTGPASPASAGLASPVAVTSFVSKRYGYRLVYPTDWTATETPGTGGLHPDEPGVDTFKDPIGHILSVVGEPATALSGWTCAIDRHLENDHGLAVESVENLTVAGVPARLSAFHLVIKPYVIHYLTVELVHDGRGLTLSLESTTKRDGEDRAMLDSLLASFELTGGA